LTQLIALVGSAGSWRKSVVDRAVNWTTKASGSPPGDAQLLHYIGDLLYKGKWYHLAGLIGMTDDDL